MLSINKCSQKIFIDFHLFTLNYSIDIKVSKKHRIILWTPQNIQRSFLVKYELLHFMTSRAVYYAEYPIITRSNVTRIIVLTCQSRTLWPRIQPLPKDRTQHRPSAFSVLRGFDGTGWYQGNPNTLSLALFESHVSVMAITVGFL